jgi:RNA polymerase sigma factor (sigma-70 family)
VFFLSIENKKDAELFGKYITWTSSCFSEARGRLTMIRAPISANLGRHRSEAEADEHRPVCRQQKRRARLSSGIVAYRQPRRAAEARPVAHGMEALQEIILGSRSKFIATAHAILRNREDAEDAVQDAFLSAYLHLPSFDGRSALTTWFTRIVMNAALMIRRKQKSKSAWMISQPATDNSDDAEWMENIPTSRPNPEVVYAERETLQYIEGALGKLKPVLRQAFALTYFDEMLASEACAVLGTSTAALKSRRLRARRQLFNQVQRLRVAHVRGASPSHTQENTLLPVTARTSETPSSEVSGS